MSFIAIRDGSDNYIAWWAIPLAWAFVYATLMLATVRLEVSGPTPGAHVKLAMTLSGSALVISIGGLAFSPVMGLTTLSALILLTGIRRQR